MSTGVSSWWTSLPAKSSPFAAATSGRSASPHSTSQPHVVWRASVTPERFNTPSMRLSGRWSAYFDTARCASRLSSARQRGTSASGTGAVTTPFSSAPAGLPYFRRRVTFT
ncbi:MAG: hypothetical protein BWX69_03262 [Planctomycetes bacterium ADurb.Bin069]|nr:MAG: hypothetical protein BWX69_03262 [Planctomycetes bacterium ADurb.Bin069]